MMRVLRDESLLTAGFGVVKKQAYSKLYSFQYYAHKRLRPFARRARKTLRPPTVAMRERKP